jgi:hypothetical protein
MTSTLSAHFMLFMDTIHKNQNAKVGHVRFVFKWVSSNQATRCLSKT